MDIERIKQAYNANNSLLNEDKLIEIVSKYLPIIEKSETELLLKCFKELTLVNDYESKLDFSIIDEEFRDKSINIEVAFSNKIDININDIHTTYFYYKLEETNKLNVYFLYTTLSISVNGQRYLPLRYINLSHDPLFYITLEEDEVKLISNFYSKFGRIFQNNHHSSNSQLSKIVEETIKNDFTPIFKHNNYNPILTKFAWCYDSDNHEEFYRTSFYFEGSRYGEIEISSNFLLNKSRFMSIVDEVVYNAKRDLIYKLRSVLTNDILDDIIVNNIQSSHSIKNRLSLDFSLAQDTTVTNDLFTIIKFVHFAIKNNKLYISIPYLLFTLDKKNLYIPLSEDEYNEDYSIDISSLNINQARIIEAIKSDSISTNLNKLYLNIFTSDFQRDFTDMFEEIFKNYSIQSGADVDFDEDETSTTITIYIDIPKF